MLISHKMTYFEEITYFDSFYQAGKWQFGKNKKVFRKQLGMQMPILRIVFLFEGPMGGKSHFENMVIWPIYY